MSLVDIIVIVIVVSIATGTILFRIKRKKNGDSPCGHCPVNSQCHGSCEENPKK